MGILFAATSIRPLGSDTRWRTVKVFASYGSGVSSRGWQQPQITDLYEPGSGFRLSFDPFLAKISDVLKTSEQRPEIQKCCQVNLKENITNVSIKAEIRKYVFPFFSLACW